MREGNTSVLSSPGGSHLIIVLCDLGGVYAARIKTSLFLLATSDWLLWCVFSCSYKLLSPLCSGASVSGVLNPAVSARLLFLYSAFQPPASFFGLCVFVPLACLTYSRSSFSGLTPSAFMHKTKILTQSHFARCSQTLRDIGVV